MKKILYFTDPHIYDKPISSRLDDSSQAILGKIRYLSGYADIGNGFTHVVCGGDLTTGNIDSNPYIREVLHTFRQFNVPVVSVIGNHDFPYTETTGYNRWLLGLLEAAGLVDVPPVQHGLYHGLGTSYLFAHAYNDVLLQDPEMCGVDPSLVKTIFAHHYIGYGSDRLSLYPEKVKKVFPNLKYIFSGHDHKVYGTVEHPCGVTSFRPGSLLRAANDETQNRDPVQFMVLDFDDNDDLVSHEYRQVSVAKPAGSIFASTAKMINKATEASVEAFVQGFASAQQAQSNDLVDILNHSISQVADPDVREYLQKTSQGLVAALNAAAKA